MHPGPRPGLLGTGDHLAGKRVQKTIRSLCPMPQGGLADVAKHVHSTFYLPERSRRPTGRNAQGHKMLRHLGHLTRCCQFDDGTRHLAEITYKDALKKHGCLDMEDLRFEAEFLTWDQASLNSFTFACHLTSTIGIRVQWDPFNPDWIASAANIDLAEVTINTQHPIYIHLKNEQKWAAVVETKEAGKLVKMRAKT